MNYFEVISNEINNIPPTVSYLVFKKEIAEENIVRILEKLPSINVLVFIKCYMSQKLLEIVNSLNNLQYVYFSDTKDLSLAPRSPYLKSCRYDMIDTSTECNFSNNHDSAFKYYYAKLAKSTNEQIIKECTARLAFILKTCYDRVFTSTLNNENEIFNFVVDRYKKHHPGEKLFIDFRQFIDYVDPITKVFVMIRYLYGFDEEYFNEINDHGIDYPKMIHKSLSHDAFKDFRYMMYWAVDEGNPSDLADEIFDIRYVLQPHVNDNFKAAMHEHFTE